MRRALLHLGCQGEVTLNPKPAAATPTVALSGFHVQRRWPGPKHPLDPGPQAL